MNELVENWTLNSGVLAWFATALAQVTVLASLVLAAAQVAKKDAALRHGILATGLMLIVISPLSTYFIQRSGFGLLAISTNPPPAVQSNTASRKGRPVQCLSGLAFSGGLLSRVSS